MSEIFEPTISRRTMLRGAIGSVTASLTLPWLESMAFASGPKLAEAVPPRRWATLIFANGVNEAHWWVKGDQHGIAELSDTLKPLEPHRKNLLFLKKLHLFDDTKGVHTPFFTNFLCGEPLGAGGIPDLATSVDQLLAKHIGKNTPVPSMVLGTEPANYGLAGGKPAIYNATISWSSPTTPVVPTIYPRQAFDRLFDVSGLKDDRSVLDFVNAQAKSLKPTLSRRDAHKLDEFMTSVREIEQRIDRATSPPDPDAWQPTLEEPDLARPGDGIPTNIDEHMKLMLDILVLAFRMDKTRIATFLFERDITSLNFSFLEGVGNSGMHTISHHRKRPETLEEYRRINAFHVKKLRYVLDRMAAVDEGNGSLLDNTIMLFGSTMMDGDTHYANDLPLIMCGGRNCGLAPGRVLEYETLEDRRLCNLHLATAQMMGLNIDQVGNSIKPLPGLRG